MEMMNPFGRTWYHRPRGRRHIVHRAAYTPSIKFIQGPRLKRFADTDADHDLRGRGIHRIDIAEINDHTFVAKMFQWGIDQVKMHLPPAGSVVITVCLPK